MKETLLAHMDKLSHVEVVDFHINVAVIARAMKKHTVEWASYEEREIVPVDFDDHPTSEFRNHMFKWHWQLASLVSRLTYCKTFSRCVLDEQFPIGDKGRYGRKVYFFGEIDSLTVATLLYDKWNLAVDTFATQATSSYCKKLSKQYGLTGSQSAFRIAGLGDKHPCAFRNTWLTKLFDGLNKAVDEINMKVPPLYNELMEAHWQKFLKNSRRRKLPVDNVKVV